MIEGVLGAAIGEALGAALISLAKPLCNRPEEPVPSIVTRVDPSDTVRTFLASMSQIHAPNHHITELAVMLRSFDGVKLMTNYAVAALADETFNVEEALKAQTVATVRATCDIAPNEAETYGEILYDVLSDTADQLYRLASRYEDNHYFYYARRLSIAGALDELDRTATLLGHVSPARRVEYLTYMEQYASSAEDHYRRIRVPNLTHSMYVDLDSIFVKPTLRHPRAPTEDDDYEDGEPSLETFTETLYRCVVLGDPGAGKSTLARWFVRETIEGASPKSHFAAVVVVRDYAADWKRQPQSIVEYLENQSNSLLQIPAPEGAVEYLLTTGRAVVVFDGLDETLQVAKRQKVVDVVQAFARRYPTVSILVTSRKVGYLQAPLDAEVFETLELGPLSDLAIQQYAHKWFRMGEECTPTESEAKARAFLAELEGVPDLRTNALMLSLLASLYVGGGYIPRNRAEVYERCSELLFMLWDRSRGIDAPPFTWDIKQALYFIAHWMYTSEELESGVPRRKIQRALRDYLLDRRYADSDHADEAASEFLDLWRGRAWVLTDVGTGKQQEVYQFSHQTFLEYYTAMHLARVHSSPEALWDALRDRVLHQEWTVVSEIAVQLLSRHVDRANDDYLELVLGHASERDPDGARLIIAYAARLVEGLGPRPEVLSRLVKLAVEAWVEEVDATVGQRHGSDDASWVARTALEQVLDVHEPLRTAVSEAVRRTCRELTSRSLQSETATAKDYELRELLFILVAAADVIAPPFRPRVEREVNKWQEESRRELHEWVESFGLAFVTENPANAVAAVRSGVVGAGGTAESLGLAFALQGIDHPLLMRALPSPAGIITSACLLGREDARWRTSESLAIATASAMRSSLESGATLRQGEHSIATILPVELLQEPCTSDGATTSAKFGTGHDEYFVSCVTLLACHAAAVWDKEGQDRLALLPEPYRAIADSSRPSDEALDDLRERLSPSDATLVDALATGNVIIFR